MKYLRVLAVALAVMPVFACEKPVFHKLDLDQALARAKSEKKVVMIDFYADWCGPCQMQDRTTFTNEYVQQLLDHEMVAIKINIDDNQKLARQYNVTGIPCLVFLNGEGKEIGRMEGLQDVESFLKRVDKILK